MPSSQKIQSHESGEVVTSPCPHRRHGKLSCCTTVNAHYVCRGQFLEKRDAGRGLVAFVDIADDNYTPVEHGGIDFEAAMGRIHAVFLTAQSSKM
jgi:hypothetical protein